MREQATVSFHIHTCCWSALMHFCFALDIWWMCFCFCCVRDYKDESWNLNNQTVLFKQPNCAFLVSLSESPCFGIMSWTQISLDHVVGFVCITTEALWTALQCAATVVSLQTFLLYVAMYVWLMMTAVLWESWENSLFILHFLHSKPRSAGSLIYTGIQDALHHCAPTGSVLVSRTKQASFYT